MEFLLVVVITMCVVYLCNVNKSIISRAISFTVALICIAGFLWLLTLPIEMLDREVRLTEDNKIKLNGREFEFDSEKKVICIAMGRKYLLSRDIIYKIEDLEESN